MEADHSEAAPSSAARRKQCPASTRMEARFPETEETEEQREGEAAHWALAEVLHGRTIAAGQIAPNRFVLTDEIVEGADDTHDYLVRRLQPYGLTPEQGAIEQPVSIPRVHPKSWGTPDYRIWLTPRLLLCLDYKFGHRVVDAFENDQMIEYVAGICDPLPAGVTFDTEVNVLIVIAQPRSYHREGPIREWTTNLGALRGEINKSSGAAHEALGDISPPRFRVGPECRDCRARTACEAFLRDAQHAMDYSKHVPPLTLSPAALSLELRLARRYLARLTALESGLSAQVLELAKRGVQVPSWRVEHGTGRAAWKRPHAEIIAIGKALGLQLAREPEALTPRQAQKAGLDPSVVAEFSERKRAEATLVEDDGSAARRVFT